MSVNNDQKPPSDEQAAELVRRRIDALYGEIDDQLKETGKLSPLVESFWLSNHSHPEPHKAWNEYYNSLSEDDKHRLWEEYHLQVGRGSGLPSSAQSIETRQSETVANVKKRLLRRVKKDQPSGPFRSFIRNHVWPLASAALVVSFVWLIFNNELIVARMQQFVSPGNSDTSPTIIDPSIKVGKQSRIIIPKINVDVPVVYDVTSYSETDIQNGLERGVVHYGATALPGQRGNNVIVGHSSNNFFNSGKYKFAFVLLNRLEVGDTFILHYKGTRYVYQVTLKEVVTPTDFTYVQPTDVPTVTLITCDPPGTSWRRLVIQGEQISPDPTEASRIDTDQIEPEAGEVVPGNAPSLWSRLWNAIF